VPEFSNADTINNITINSTDLSTVLLFNIWDISDLSDLQCKDLTLLPYIKYLQKSELPADLKTASKIVSECRDLIIENNVLYYVWTLNDFYVRGETRRQAMLPKSLHIFAIQACYDDLLTGGHLGLNKTYRKL
jgi:hypothetical protein